MALGLWTYTTIQSISIPDTTPELWVCVPAAMGAYTWVFLTPWLTALSIASVLPSNKTSPQVPEWTQWTNRNLGIAPSACFSLRYALVNSLFWQGKGDCHRKPCFLHSFLCSYIVKPIRWQQNPIVYGEVIPFGPPSFFFPLFWKRRLAL